MVLLFPPVPTASSPYMPSIICGLLYWIGGTTLPCLPWGFRSDINVQTAPETATRRTASPGGRTDGGTVLRGKKDIGGHHMSSRMLTKRARFAWMTTTPGRATGVRPCLGRRVTDLKNPTLFPSGLCETLALTYLNPLAPLLHDDGPWDGKGCVAPSGRTGQSRRRYVVHLSASSPSHAWARFSPGKPGKGTVDHRVRFPRHGDREGRGTWVRPFISLAGATLFPDIPDGCLRRPLPRLVSDLFYVLSNFLRLRLVSGWVCSLGRAAAMAHQEQYLLLTKNCSLEQRAVATAPEPGR